MKKKGQILLAALTALVFGVGSVWLIQSREARKFEALKANAICVLELADGTRSTTAVITNNQPIETFHVGLQTRVADGTVSISISGEQGPIGNAAALKAGSFGLGRAVPAGQYKVTLSQNAQGRGATLAIAQTAPVFVTGWQIWSRAYVGLLALTGVCMVLWRKSNDPRKRDGSAATFHHVLLGFILIFTYLLFHEGGHALAQVAFGHFDWSRSDFWGIRGHPHSGGKMGPALEPWQQLMISWSGPMLPTLAGLGLFAVWSLPWARRARADRPMLNLYASALVAMLVFPEAVCEPAYLLGLIRAEGDPIGFAARNGGNTWVARGALLGMFVLCVVILWRVGPEIWRAWRGWVFGGRWNADRS